MNCKIVCPVCNETGTVILKKSSTNMNGKIYHYKKWNIYHHNDRKWCYLNKNHMNLQEIKSLLFAKYLRHERTGASCNPRISSF